MTRRSWLALLAALTAGVAALPAQSTSPQATLGGRPRFNFGPVGAIQKVADNLYVIPGAGGNTSVYVTTRGVVVVDTKTPDNGQAIVDQIKTVTDKPITHVINTHIHFDHTGSNAFFPEAVEIVAHANLAASLVKDPAYQDPAAKRGLVDRIYTDTLTLFSGDDTIELYNFGASHTNGDSFVVFRKARAIATGDVFANRGQPIIDTANGGSGVNYPAVVDKALATTANVDMVIPGHAGVMKRQDLVDFGEFHHLFLRHARAALAAGKTPVQAMDEFKAALPARFAGYTLGAGMMTGPGGNFEPLFKELQQR